MISSTKKFGRLLHLFGGSVDLLISRDKGSLELTFQLKISFWSISSVHIHMKYLIAYWLVLNFLVQVLTNQDTTRIFERCALFSRTYAPRKQIFSYGQIQFVLKLDF